MTIGRSGARTSRTLVGFFVGAALAVLGVRYIPEVNKAVLGGDRDVAAAGAVGEVARSAAAPAGSVASRLSYDLSRVPSERPVAVQPKAAVAESTPPAPAAATGPAAQGRASESAPGEYVANARPISNVPPDPRDRTREIQKEAQNPQYRETVRPGKAAGARVFEGRDVPLTPSPVESSRGVVPNQTAPSKPTAPTAGNSRPPASGATGSPAQLQTPVAIDPASEPAAPAKSPEVNGAAAKSAPADAVDSRFQATREWLTSAPQTTHTIQLMGVSNEAQLRPHLDVLLKLLESGKVYVFRTVAQGKPSITVVYGAYADRQSALNALDDLPAAAAAYRPVLRTVNGIRTELKQHGLDQAP